MKEIKIYEAKDGTRFNHEGLCIIHEQKIDRIAEIMKPLGEWPSLPSGTWIKRDRNLLASIKSKIWEFVLVEFGDQFPEWKNRQASEVGMFSVVGRVLGDSGSPLSGAWGRLCKMDFDLGREYDQPYFALHPEEAVEYKK